MNQSSNSSHKLWELAKTYQKKSHAPYSKAHIAAALILENGKTYGGCNIENASYGATVCAERVAIWKAMSEEGAQRIKEIVVLSDANPPWPPCGMCRQVIAEFADGDTLIHLANHQGIQKTYKFSEIMPLSFTPEHLKK